MTQQQFKTFVEEYSQKYGKVKEMLDQTQRPAKSAGTTATPGDSRLQTGTGVSGNMTITGTENLSPDEIKKLNEAKLNKVSPEYRKEVEAFFRSISENSAAASKPSK